MKKEVPAEGDFPIHRFEEPETVRPGVVAGITGVRETDGAGSDSDFGLASGGSLRDVTRRYERLTDRLGMSSAAVARQVHGTRVAEVDTATGRGALVIGEADGLMTSVPGILLAVTAADCVPLFLIDIRGRCVALLHAGWRGASAGILESAVERIESRYAVAPSDLALYLGPAICGQCYVVGAAVLDAFGRSARDAAAVDLHLELAERAAGVGVDPGRVARSAWCTKCGPVRLHSHRGQEGGAGRMAAFLGLQLPGGAQAA